MHYKHKSYLWSSIGRWAIATGITVLVTCIFASVRSAYATTYGSGSYNNCGYNNNCQVKAIAPATMPNGLKVIINLSDGQTIPTDGKDITITQLSGNSGVTFKSASILIEGNMVADITPDQTGTAKWHWDPHANAGTHVAIVVTASDGTTSTYNYTVQLASASPSPAAVPDIFQSQPAARAAMAQASEERTLSGPIALLASVVPTSVKQFFRSLSPEAVDTFPYLLFIALGLVAVVALLQIRRELRASRTIRDAVEQEKLMIELKKNFMGLASHYLRTPLTLIVGSIDMLGLAKEVADEYVQQLNDAAKQLSEHIETTISSSRNPEDDTPEPIPPTKASVRVGVAVAIMVVAIVSLLFNLLSYISGQNLPMVNIVTQVAVFAAVSMGVYQVDRRFTLRRLEHKAQNDVLVMQRRLQETQDTFLERTATQLFQDYETLYKLASPIPLTTASKPLHEGLGRLRSVVSKCRTAQLIKGSRSVRAAEPTDLKTIFDHSDVTLTERIATKHLQLVEAGDMKLKLPEPPLVKYVAHSLIDNAVAYSPDGGTITMGASDRSPNVVLTVMDNGQGISGDRQQLLFQPLSKIEGYEHFDHEGMGFSLYLDRLIMQYLGGSIELVSEESKGTTVNLSMPVAA